MYVPSHVAFWMAFCCPSALRHLSLGTQGGVYLSDNRFSLRKCRGLPLGLCVRASWGVAQRDG